MAPGRWTPLNQSHIGNSGCRISVLLLPFLSHPPFAVSPLSHSSLSCCLSSPALALFLCSLSMPPLPPCYLSPSLLSVSLNIFPFRRLAQTAKMLFHKGKLCISQLVRRRASRTHRGRRRSRCWRVTTVRLSSALVPLGGTCIVGRNYFMNNLPYLSLIVKRNILSERSPTFVWAKQHCVHGLLSYFFGLWLCKFKGMVWNMTSSQGDVIWGLGEKV